MASQLNDQYSCLAMKLPISLASIKTKTSTEIPKQEKNQFCGNMSEKSIRATKINNEQQKPLALHCSRDIFKYISTAMTSKGFLLPVIALRISKTLNEGTPRFGTMTEEEKRAVKFLAT